MANKNILIRRRKDGNWENIFPITIDSNVFDSQGVALPEKLSQIDGDLNNAVYALGNSQTAPDYNNLASSIPSYWVSHVNSKIATIRGLQRAGGVNSSSFGFITDIHYERNAKYYGALLARIDDYCKLNHIVNGGDTTSNNNSKEQFIDDMRTAFKQFGQVEDKTFFTIGNHDDNPYGGVQWNRLVKDTEQYSEFFRGYGNKVTYGASGKYYFIDNTFHKIRHIVLDVLDIPYIQEGSGAKYSGENMSAYRQEQVNWFANVALAVPDSSWNVVVTSHIPPYSTGVTGATGTPRNSDIMMGLLGAFKNKTSYSGTSLTAVPTDLKVTITKNFAGAGGNAICWNAGHCHYDNMVDMPVGIKLVTTMNDSTDGYLDAPSKTRGTSTEQAFDIFTVNTSTKTVNLTRIGAGSNRQFTY